MAILVNKMAQTTVKISKKNDIIRVCPVAHMYPLQSKLIAWFCPTEALLQ